MAPSQRTLALALVLGAYFSCTGNQRSHPGHTATQLIAHVGVQATHLAAQLEIKTANLLTICTAHFGGCDRLPGTLERLGVPTELVRESA